MNQLRNKLHIVNNNECSDFILFLYSIEFNNVDLLFNNNLYALSVSNEMKFFKYGIKNVRNETPFYFVFRGCSVHRNHWIF